MDENNTATKPYLPGIDPNLENYVKIIEDLCNKIVDRLVRGNKKKHYDRAIRHPKDMGQRENQKRV